MGPVEVLWDRDGVPPLKRTWEQWKYYGMEMGSPLGVDRQTDTCKNSTFPILRMRAVMITSIERFWYHTPFLFMWKHFIAGTVLWYRITPVLCYSLPNWGISLIVNMKSSKKYQYYSTFINCIDCFQRLELIVLHDNVLIGPILIIKW